MKKTTQLNIHSMVKYLSKECFSAHRGNVPLEDGRNLLFGNDGYGGSEKVRREVELVRQRIKELGFLELAFTTDGAPEHYSWGLLVQGGEDTKMRDLIWAAWFEACGMTKQSATSAAADDPG